MIGRLVQSVDFERVLRTRTRVSSVHFALHHLAALPSKPAFARSTPVVPDGAFQPLAPQLSTNSVSAAPGPVDDSVISAVSLPFDTVGEVWLGAVVPKRHAKRAVTRTLLKRQIRNVMADRHGLLTSGLWVVRLRAPFDRARFPSAASEAMKRLARDELEQLLATAIGRAGNPVDRRRPSVAG